MLYAMEIKRNNRMKKVLALAMILTATPAYAADTYVEYKNELKYSHSARQDTINHFRVGYETKNPLTGNKYYIESGYTTDGSSVEMGYKIKKGYTTFKGKWEGVDTDTFKHKLETEIRYTF